MVQNVCNSKIRLFLSKLFCSDDSYVFYIGGADVLPPPLSAEKEAEAISRMKDDRGMADLLISHN